MVGCEKNSDDSDIMKLHPITPDNNCDNYFCDSKIYQSEDTM